VTTISNGTLAIGGGGTTGSIASTSTVDNAALQFNRSDALTYSGTISGTGILRKTGNGTLTLSGVNTYSGGTTVGLGTIEFTQRTGLGTGTITLNDSSTNGDVTLSSLYSVLTSSVPTDSNYFISNSITVTPRTSGASGTTTLRTTDTAGGPKTAFSGTLTLNAPLTIIAGNTDRTSWYGQITGDGNLTVTGSITGGCPAGGNQCRFTLNRDTSLTALANDFTGTLSIVGTGTKVQFTPLSGGTTNTVPPGISLNLGSGTQVYNYLNFQARSLTGSGTLNGMDTSTVTVENLTDSTFSGSIINSSGTLSLIKSGAGTLTLSGNNTYSGTSTITAGTLSIGNGGTAGSIASTTINNNGLLTFNRLDDLTYSGVISGTGGLSKLGAGVLYLTGTNDYSGTSTITEGTLSIGNGGASGSINSAAINNSGTLIFNRTNNSTYGGTISGTGTLTKLGTGTLYFTGENDYGGVSTITAGTLSIGDGGTTGSISNSSISNSGSLHFNRSNNSTYSGVISGTGTLTKLGAGTLYLTGANTYSGTSSITAGTLSLGDGGATGSVASTTISNNGSLEFNRSNDLTYSGVISGTGSLSKRGTGALTLSGANTFDGATTISEGTLVASHNSALGSATGGTTIQSGATLQISNGTTISAENLTLNGSGVSASSGALLLSNTGNYLSNEITLASDSKILINGSATDPTVVLGAISGSSSSLTVDIPSGRQVSQSAAVNLNKLAFTGSSGVVNFSNAGNTVSTIAADTGTLTYVNSSNLTIGTVNPSGITTTGPLSITTTSGDLTVSAPISASNTISLSTNSGDLIVGASITTSNASATAIVLNAGTVSAAGTETGGDIQVASGVTIASSGSGRTTLYTGSVAGSSGINNVVSYSSGNFRYNADEASVTPAGIAAGSSGAYAIYREQPTISVQADNKTKIFDYIAFPAAQLTSTCTGCANGDSPVITYTGIAGNGNAVYIGAYPITATYDATYLGNVGYRVVGSEVTPGTLSIVPFPGYIPPPRETVERTSQIPIRYLIENMQPTKLKTALADHPSLVSLFSSTTAKGNIRLAYQDGTVYREDIRLREGIIRDTIFFDSGKPSLSNEATRTLDSLLRTANRYNLSAVEVVGHTELPNSPEDALKLSEERAKVVSEYLQNRWSLDKRPAKITSLGRSYLQPISDNITYSGRARNRRTEVTITGVYLE
jgi:autotransporter-associated beta strand protein